MKKIVVLGSFIVDLMGRAPHLPSPGETVRGTFFGMGPGGKGANQCIAAKRAGGNVTMITKIGNDEMGKIATQNFERENIDTKFVFVSEEHPTGTALIFVDDITGQNEILVNSGACEAITESEIDSFHDEIASASIFLTQLETNLDSVEKSIDIAWEHGVKVVLNPAPIVGFNEEILKKVFVLTPNEHEAAAISGVPVVTIVDARRAAKIIQSKGVANVIITLGIQGSLVVTPDQEKIIPCLKVKALDTTGAGDAYNGGLAVALSEGKDIFEAAEFANVVASLSVTKIGTAAAMPYRDEIDNF